MSDQKTDWRTLEAGRELDRVIAKILGWKFDVFSDGRFQTTTPNGTTGGKYLRRKDSEFLLPGFSTDLNAAFTLFITEPGLEWNLFSEWGDNWITCELGHWHEPEHGNQLEQATEKTAALAICKAWLKWQERTDHPAPEFKP